MDKFLAAINSQLNPKVNAPQWAATLTGLIAATFGLATDDPWLIIIGTVIGALFGWVVQKVFTVPKLRPDIDEDADDGEPHGDPTVGEPDPDDFPAD